MSVENARRVRGARRILLLVRAMSLLPGSVLRALLLRPRCAFSSGGGARALSAVSGAVRQALAGGAVPDAQLGTAIRDNVRRISQGDGESVSSVAAGLAAINAGRAVNFDGASGPVSFDERGDIQGTKFRYEQADGGRFRLLELI